MKLALITDAWLPQVNGVVTTLLELVEQLRGQGHVVELIEPALFSTRPCPGYAGIRLAMWPGKQVSAMLDGFAPDCIHIATEGPLGWAARSYCIARQLAFTTAFHTKFPEIINAAVKFPLSWGYAALRHFHGPSSAVMVPTAGVVRMLERRGFRKLREWTHGVDTELFSFNPAARNYAPLGLVERPLSLFVGRISYEKNITAYLELDIPGTKVVCGTGPVEARLRLRYPQVRWLGVLPRTELARVYAAADLLVFPSHADTFGLVMLEAMACGTPVAAYPVHGPVEVLDDSDAGRMDSDLRTACLAALALPRSGARRRALAFSWAEAVRQFAANLVPCTSTADVNSVPKSSGSATVTPLTQTQAKISS